LWEKTRTIAQEIYGAADIAAEASVRAKFDELESAGWGSLPVCVAQTQYSFSDDPSLMGAPSGHIPRSATCVCAQARGFVVVLMGDIRTMRDLPRIPAAERFAWSTGRSTDSFERTESPVSGLGGSSRDSSPLLSARHRAARNFVSSARRNLLGLSAVSLFFLNHFRSFEAINVPKFW